MNILCLLIQIIEILLYISILVFIVTTFYLIETVKKSDHQMLRNAVRNPILPNIDLGFFNKLQKRYLVQHKSRIPPVANRISFFAMIILFSLLFVFVVVRESLRF